MVFRITWAWFPVVMLDTRALWPSLGLSTSPSLSLDLDNLLHKATTRIECLKKSMFSCRYSSKLGSFFIHTFHLLRAWKFLKFSILISLSFLVCLSSLEMGWKIILKFRFNPFKYEINFIYVPIPKPFKQILRSSLAHIHGSNFWVLTVFTLLSALRAHKLPSLSRLFDKNCLLVGNMNIFLKKSPNIPWPGD